MATLVPAMHPSREMAMSAVTVTMGLLLKSSDVLPLLSRRSGADVFDMPGDTRQLRPPEGALPAVERQV
ncbi:hypothetical protein GCM10010317_042690 [Streptomyces mirabilis]|nr:hypothetical protein GCM10010317_042690 [Streptomyces mirabilis]